MDIASALDALRKFEHDHPHPKSCGFTIMPFGADTLRDNVLAIVRAEFLKFGITILRADDVDYHSKIWGNIETYMRGCGFGVAIFDGRDQVQFNPNVSNEIGYMMALGKPILLLKEKSIPSLNTDITDSIYSVFDIGNPAASLPRIINKFIRDYDLGLKSEIMTVVLSLSEMSEDRLMVYQTGLELLLPRGSARYLRLEKRARDGKIMLLFNADKSAYEKIKQIVGQPLMEGFQIEDAFWGSQKEEGDSIRSDRPDVLVHICKRDAFADGLQQANSALKFVSSPTYDPSRCEVYISKIGGLLYLHSNFLSKIFRTTIKVKVMRGPQDLSRIMPYIFELDVSKADNIYNDDRILLAHIRHIKYFMDLTHFDKKQQDVDMCGARNVLFVWPR